MDFPPDQLGTNPCASWQTLLKSYLSGARYALAEQYLQPWHRDRWPDISEQVMAGKERVRLEIRLRSEYFAS